MFLSQDESLRAFLYPFFISEFYIKKRVVTVTVGDIFINREEGKATYGRLYRVL